jgi:hypothetical protein
MSERSVVKFQSMCCSFNPSIAGLIDPRCSYTLIDASALGQAEEHGMLFSSSLVYEHAQ